MRDPKRQQESRSLGTSSAVKTHRRQPLWSHAIDAPTWFVPGTALAMQEFHPMCPM